MKKELRRNKIIPRLIFVVIVLALWQILSSMEIWPKMLFPSVDTILKALVTSFTGRGLGTMILSSLILLIEGLMIGIVAALILSSLAIISPSFGAVYEMIVSMFDLIPGIALVPIAILWIGIGDGAIIFMVFHSVVWPMSRSIIDGYNSVPRLYVEVGQNFGLRKLRLVLGVYFPATLPRIISGVKVGWARAWRGLISAEMIFGGSSALGIGYFITDRRTNLDVAGIFSAIIVIIVIGTIVEYGLFRVIEKNTLNKWGMTK